jgi:hypothetical protein
LQLVGLLAIGNCPVDAILIEPAFDEGNLATQQQLSQRVVLKRRGLPALESLLSSVASFDCAAELSSERSRMGRFRLIDWKSSFSVSSTSGYCHEAMKASPSRR